MWIAFAQVLGLLGLLAAAPPVQGQVLSFVQVIKDNTLVDGLDRPESVAMSPDGRHVYAASFEDNAVAVFSRDATTGALAAPPMLACEPTATKKIGALINLATVSSTIT